MEIQEAKDKLEKALKILKEDLSSIQIGQVSEKLFKNTIIQDDTGKRHILEIATIRVKSFNTLVVKPFNHNDLAAIEKSISKAGLGVNTTKQDQEILVIFPPITSEQREQIAKSIVEYGNKTKQTGRDIRHLFLKENAVNSKEEKYKIEKDIQKIIDQFNDNIETVIKNKQEAILKI